ncbi:MAG TPA: extracellular solute-binding protein [Rectinemataceae bacterium]|nr:extracellular solute-binding protein [Rectinemataceae bacterium]
MSKNFCRRAFAALCLALAASTGAGAQTKLSPKERTVTITLSENANQPIRDFALAQQEIFKKTNVKIHFEAVPSSNYEDKKKILLATDSLPDIISVKQQDVNDFGATGVFLPLKQYIDKGYMPNFKKFWDTIPAIRNTLVDGELYAFPVIARNEAKNGPGPVIRMDLLEKHGIPVPKTFDELLAALAKLKAIYPDSVPWTVRKSANPIPRLINTTMYMLGSGGNVTGIYFEGSEAEGKYVFGPATKEFKEGLRFLAKAYSMKVLDPDYSVTTAQQWTQNLTSGRSFFFMDNSGLGLNYTNDLRKKDPNAKLQIIPIPRNAVGRRRAEFFNTTLSGISFAVSAKVKDPLTVIKFIDWMYSKEGSDISNFGVEGQTYTLDAKGNPSFIPAFVEKFKDARPAPYYAIYTELGITKLNFSLWAANTLTQFQIEKLTGTWSKLYDEYWKIVDADEAYRDPIIDPPLSSDEAERVKDILASLNTMLEQEYDKFIMGVKPIDQYDDVIKRAKQMGSAELETIYNGALARLRASMKD